MGYISNPMELDHIRAANKKSGDQFIDDYFPPRDQWAIWKHPESSKDYSITLQNSASLSADDLDTCFRLIELSSREDYKRSKSGWKPNAKRKEMRLLDLKYLIVQDKERIEGFCSFMPTVEDEYCVIYCYEIHLAPCLQGSGLGKVLMSFLDSVGGNIPDVEKIMLTCFVSNAKALHFYQKLGFEPDEYSPPPKILRNGTKVEADYVILSKQVLH